MVLLPQPDLEGKPPLNYETVVNLIGATTTESGLKVPAILDTNEYEKGVKVSKDQMTEIPHPPAPSPSYLELYDLAALRQSN
jgi:hypothetical protein